MIRVTLGEWRVVYPRCLVSLVARRRLIPLGRYAASLDSSTFLVLIPNIYVVLFLETSIQAY